jgi:sterol desaturase/sphingolipid hydroxylase (fatty acid hydroxylase superfamily)
LHSNFSKNLWLCVFAWLAYELPKGRYGVNFGISLSIWDYIFKTNYIPEESGTIELGFKGNEVFPKDFIRQNTHGFKKQKKG